MRYGILIALLMAAIHSNGQSDAQVEHAPTVEQCQADARLWSSKFNVNDDKQNPKMEIITRWASEMNDCSQVDQRNEPMYLILRENIRHMMSARMTNFIMRHHFFHQFVAEDAAGER